MNLKGPNFSTPYPPCVYLISSWKNSATLLKSIFDLSVYFEINTRVLDCTVKSRFEAFRSACNWVVCGLERVKFTVVF